MTNRALIPAAKVLEARCGDCGQDTLQGRTAAGLDVVLDRAPLSALGELAAAMAGVGTVTHHRVAGELHHRTPWAVRHRPAGSRPRESVHAYHRHGQAWPAAEPQDTAAPDSAPDDAPPF